MCVCVCVLVHMYAEPARPAYYCTCVFPSSAHSSPPQPSPPSFGDGPHALLLENLFHLMHQMTEGNLEEDDDEAILGRRSRIRLLLEDSPDRPARYPLRRFRRRRWSITSSDGSSDDEVELRPPTPRPQMPHPQMLPTTSDSMEVWDELPPPLPPHITLPRPNLTRRSDSPILPPLHPSTQPDRQERSHSASNLSDGHVPLMDEALLDESIFDSPRDNNRLNDLSAVSSLHQLPSLPPLLQPFSNSDSPTSLSQRQRLSSDVNGGRWDSGSLHVSCSNSSVSKASDNVGSDVEDNDIEFQAAIRQSMAEAEGGDNDGEWRNSGGFCAT